MPVTKDDNTGCLVWLMVLCMSAGVGTWNVGLGLVVLGIFVFLILLCSKSE